MAFWTGTRRVGARAAVALVLAAALAWRGAADPQPTPSTLSTPPVVTEVGGKTLAQWVADLKHADPSVREEAIRAIPYFGAAASEAVPRLLEHVHDPDLSPRSKAVTALGMVPVDEKDRLRVIEALGTALADDPQAMVRYDAAVALIALGADAKAVIGSILHGVEDPSSWEIRRAAIAALVTAGQTPMGPDARATHALLTALTDRAAAVRLEAVMALGEMGRPADAALLVRVVSSVKGMNNDKDKTVAVWAHLSMMALDKLDDADVEFLERCAKTGELERVRVNAVRALGTVAMKDKRALPLLIELLADDNVNVQGTACVALGGLGKDAPAEAEKALTDLSQAKDAKEAVKAAAQSALDAIKKARTK